MTPFEAYSAYVALHSHFNKKSYDYFKYSGRSTVTPDSFENRNDRYHFAKLAKHDDAERIIIANLVGGPSDYIGDIVTKTGFDVYWSWLGRVESLAYTFKSELSSVEGSLLDIVSVKQGQHPRLLRMLLKGQVSYETFLILTDLLRFTTKWNQEIMDPVIWPSIALKVKKYGPFLEYNRLKMKDVYQSVLDERD